MNTFRTKIYWMKRSELQFFRLQCYSHSKVCLHVLLPHTQLNEQLFHLCVKYKIQTSDSQALARAHTIACESSHLCSFVKMRLSGTAFHSCHVYTAQWKNTMEGMWVYVCAYYTCTCTFNDSDLLTLSKLLLCFVKVEFKAQTFNQLSDRIPVGVTFLEEKNKDQHNRLQRTKRLHIDVPLNTMFVSNVICFISVIKVFLFLPSRQKFKKFHN